MDGPWQKYATGPWTKYADASYGNETGGDELIATAGPGAADAIPAESPPTKRQLLDAGIKESQKQSKYYTGKANALDLAERSLDVPGAFKSLINLPNRLTGQPDYPALVSPEQVQKVGEFLNPLAPGALPQDEVTQGLLKGGSEVVSGLTSPDVAAAALLAKKYPVPVSTLFAGETLGAIPEATRSLLESKTPGEAAERAVPTAANLLLTKLLANHLIGKGPVIPNPGPPTDIPPEAAPVEATPEPPAPVTTATLDRLEAEGKTPNEIQKEGVGSQVAGETPKSIEAVREAQPEGEIPSPLAFADEGKVVPLKSEGEATMLTTPKSVLDLVNERKAKGKATFLRISNSAKDLENPNYVSKIQKRIPDATHEIGMSTLPLWTADEFVRMTTGKTGTPEHIARAFSDFSQLIADNRGQHAWLLDGDIVGFGYDGEPLLKNVRKIADVSHGTAADFYEQWANAKGDPELVKIVAKKANEIRNAEDTRSSNPISKTSDLSPVKAAQEFDRLIMEHGLQLDWIDKPDALFAEIGKAQDTASIKAKLAKGKALQAARRKAAGDLGLKPDDVDTVAGRSKALDVLKKHIEERNAPDTLPETENADTSFLPEKNVTKTDPETVVGKVITPEEANLLSRYRVKILGEAPAEAEVQPAFELSNGKIIYGNASAHFDLLGRIPESLHDKIVNSGFVENGKYEQGGDFSKGIRPGETAKEYYSTPTQESKPTPQLRPGEKGTGDLLQGEDAPFNLAGETAVNTERVAREKADAAKKAAEAKAAQENQQPGLPLAKQETITAAAVRTPDGTIYTGKWHPAAYEEYMKAKGVPKDQVIAELGNGKLTDGFLTSEGRFVNRDDAAKIASEANQFKPDKEGDVAFAGGLKGMQNGPGVVKPPQAEAGTRVPPPEPGSMGASLGITGPLPPVNLDVGPIATAIKGFAGHTIPKFTAKLRAAGEAGTRYMSSKIAAPYNSILFSTKVLESGVDAKKFGAALTEDNLRSIRADFYREAADARSKGDHDLADELDRKAANVRSLIGARNSFQTEAEYQRFLHDPTTQEAIRVHKQLWESEIDPQYKKAQGLDPDLDLPTRGLQTGARINLKALLDDEPGRSVITAGRGSMLSTFRKKSPFAREAKGTGQRYEYDYSEIIANTFAKQSEIANQNDFHRILVENGLAKVAAKRPDMVAGEAPSRPYPLQRRLILSDGKAFAKNENLYLPQSLEAEYRTASNLDAAARVPFVKGFINLLNKGAIVSLSEATGHLWNLADAAFNLPKGKLLTDTLLKVAGRSDVVPTLFSVLRKSLADNKQQLAELANIGAMREHFSGIGPGNKVITWFDQTVRLILDDAYKGLRDSGLVENSETARREFVNQVGQYNTRAQGPLIRLLRDTGLGPFATAGRAFNVLGIKRMLLHPGVEASGTAASFALRANVLGSIVGFFVLRGVLNQVLSGNPNGRKGTRLMDVDLGLKDKTGKSMVIPLGDLLGPGRGARVTGVRGAVEAKRTGLNNAEAGDAAMRDIISSVISPAWGPAVRFGSTLIAGKQTPFSPQVAPQAKPGQNQFALNAGTAVKEANPFLSTGIDLATGKDVDTTKLAGRVAPQSRRTEEKEAVMPKIVDRAKTKDYKEWLIREAMKLPRSERSKFVNEHSKDAGFTERDKGDIQSRLRH